MPGSTGSVIIQVLLAVNAGAFVTVVHADAGPAHCSEDIAGASCEDTFPAPNYVWVFFEPPSTSFLRMARMLRQTVAFFAWI